jgi:hypothetical protein
MTVFLTSWAIEIQFSGSTWTDVTADVVISERVRFDRGISDNGPTDRVASTGRMTFTLDNSTNNSAGLAGYYSPGHVNCRTNFATGLPVRLRFTYDLKTRTKFYGRITSDGIKPSPGIYGTRRTEITVVDWMNQAATHNITLPEYTTNKRIDEVVPLIVANMPLAPLATDYQTGNDTFVSVFDSVGASTRAMTEFQKLALSEYSFIYLKCTADYDEVLVVEGRDTRQNYGVSPVSFPIVAEECSFLLMEDDFNLMTEADELLLLDETTEASFTDTGIKPDFSYGKHLANVVNVTYYPRRYDSTAATLFALQSPFQIEAGGSKVNYSCSYRDPTGGAVNVAGKEMVTPVATTHYLFNSQANGSGTNYTANLAVTAVYGANAVEYTLVNSGTATGYVTKLEAVGKGIYLYDSIDIKSQATASMALHGTYEMNISMAYQDQPETAEAVSELESYSLSSPRYELDKWAFSPNRDSMHMSAFISAEIGDRVHFEETQTGFAEDRYIDGIECEIMPNNALMASWKTRFASVLDSWYLEVDGYSEIGATTRLG